MITCPNCHQPAADDAKFCGNCASPLTKREDPFIGKCIDSKYVITERVAAGGMGVVYHATQEGVGQEVAIKMLHPRLYSDKVIVERFVNEARSYGKVTHPNAVKVHELLNVDGHICIVMEYVKGRTLTNYLEAGTVFTNRQIIDIMLQIADALWTVHQMGIVHRDLKSENIMLVETVPGRYSVKILDFGIAKILDQPKEHQTQDGLLIGTPEFMSPEQCFGEPVDNRTDIYAFGILLYLMICGRLPFCGGSQMAVLQKQIHDAVPPLSRPDGTEVLAGFAAIVLKCLEKKACDRYSTFADVITDLTCLQEGRETRVANSLDISITEMPQGGGSAETLPRTSSETGSEIEDIDTDSKTVLSCESAALSQGIGARRTSSNSLDGFVLDDSEGADSEHQSGAFVLSGTTESGSNETSARRSGSISAANEGSKPASSKSMGFVIDEIDEDDSSESDEDDSSDGGDYSLGNIDALESIESSSDSQPQSVSGSRGAMPIIAAIILVLIGSVCILWFLYDTGRINFGPLFSWFGLEYSEPEAIVTTTPKGVTVTHGSPSPTQPTSIETKPETEDLKIADTQTAPPEPAAVPEIQEKSPPSQAASREAIDRGISMALIAKTGEILKASAAPEEADKLLKNVNLKVLSETDKAAYQTIVSRSELYADLLGKAKKAKSGRRCEMIDRLSEGLDAEQDANLVQKIKSMATACNQEMAAPPTSL